MSETVHTIEHAAVTVVIPVWNSGAWIPDCLKGLAQQTFQDFSIVLVDNGSTDGSVDRLRAQCPANLNVISFPVNQGFAVAVNKGIRSATAKYVVLLNVDTIAEPQWLTELVRVMEQCPEDVGALASGMVRMDNPDLVDDAGDILSWYGSASKRGHGKPVQEYQQQDEVFSVCAGAALFRKDFFDQVGLFDERFVSYLEDIDLCLRGKIAGYKYIYVPTARVLHEGHSAGVVGSYYAYLMTRNRLMTLLKNIPCRLLFRNLHQILYGQVYFFLVYRKPFASLRGYFSLLCQLPHILRSRSDILKKKQDIRQLSDSLLSSELGEPSLMAMVKRKLRL
ncbi:MAG: glycosyltransferase family 2 protein [Thermodesulfobacteriota bacterium]|nr:glycosyltransferase family 2 protein [Thermodesulfobacteriota bacterium]